MSDFLNGLPYNNFHEHNASWFMTQTKHVLDMYASVQEEMARVIARVDELQKYIIRVFHDNFPAAVAEALDKYVQTGEVQQWINEWLSTCSLKRAQLSEGTHAALLRVVDSYMRNTNELMYMHNGRDNLPLGPYNKGTDDNPDWESRGYSWLGVNHVITYNYGCQPDGTKWKVDDVVSNNRQGLAINCSSFVIACLMGIPYELSRYRTGLGESNSPITGVGAAGYCVDVFRGNYDEAYINDHKLSWHLYRDFAAAGMGEPINDMLTNIGPGDVVFHTDAETGEISHCGIVLAVTGIEAQAEDHDHPMAIIADCANTQYPIRVAPYYYEGISSGAYDIKYYDHVAHPDYGQVPVQNARTVGSALAGTGYISFQDDFHIGQLLCLEFNVDDSNSSLNLYPDQVGSRLPGMVIAYKHGRHVKALVPILNKSPRYLFNPLGAPEEVQVRFNGSTVHDLIITDGLGPAEPIIVAAPAHTEESSDDDLWETVFSTIAPAPGDVSSRCFDVIVDGCVGFKIGNFNLPRAIRGTISTYKASSSEGAKATVTGTFQTAGITSGDPDAGLITVYGLVQPDADYIVTDINTTFTSYQGS